MRSAVSRFALVVCLGAGGLAPTIASSEAGAQPKNKKLSAEAGTDKSMEKQSAWEQKVMGDDAAKKADMKKIAAAQKLADESRKNPPPEPAKKYKDPNKEGARAKSEASIGLPIASDQAQKPQPKKAPVAKKAAPSSGNDELGALVATSLAEDHKPTAAPAPTPTDNTKSRRSKGKAPKGKSAAKPEAPSSLDRMFSAGH